MAIPCSNVEGLVRGFHAITGCVLMFLFNPCICSILNTALCYCFPFFEMLLSHYRINLVMKNTEICNGHFQLSLEFNSLGPSVAELVEKQWPQE